MSQMAEAVSDTATITRRNLKKILRVPDLLVFTLLSPIMFVLLFAFVFGSAIGDQGTGVDYREFLMRRDLRPDGGLRRRPSPATAWPRTCRRASSTGSARCRCRPRRWSSVAPLSDVGINVLSLLVMALTGLLIGWRIRSSVLEAIGGFLLLLVFAYAISWVMAYVGLLVRSPEVVNNASFMVIFPLTFIANTFVSIEQPPRPAEDLRGVEPGLLGDAGRA